MGSNTNRLVYTTFLNEKSTFLQVYVFGGFVNFICFIANWT